MKRIGNKQNWRAQYNGEEVVCCVRVGCIAPVKESIDSLPISGLDSIAGARIYFTGEVSGSSPG